MQKAKFTLDQQIEHMKEQNIKFNICSEQKARSFLSKSNYYFKVKAFSKNFQKNSKDGKYQNLDFAFLRKFTILDTLFRDLILEISLLCEHLIRTHICHCCGSNSNDNGYDAVTNFLSNQTANYQRTWLPSNFRRYDKGKSVFYLSDLLSKYRSDMPVWVFVETLNFDELIPFYEFYTNSFNYPKITPIFNLNVVKSLRNVAAHNSCLLHTLTMRPISANNFKPSVELRKFLKVKSLLSLRKNSVLYVPVVHDFLCLVLTFKGICPDTKMKEIMKNKIFEFLKKCEKKSFYFCNERLIKERYNFVKKAVENILN